MPIAGWFFRMHPVWTIRSNSYKIFAGEYAGSKQIPAVPIIRTIGNVPCPKLPSWPDWNECRSGVYDAHMLRFLHMWMPGSGHLISSVWYLRSYGTPILCLEYFPIIGTRGFCQCSGRQTSTGQNGPVCFGRLHNKIKWNYLELVNSDRRLGADIVLKALKDGDKS